MEEKVYSRAVTKTGLAGRVVDKKTLHRVFNSEELDSLAKVDDWVECDRCKHWRMIPPDANVDVSKLPDTWYCEMMNEYDNRTNWTCSIPERDAVWYNKHFKKPNVSRGFSSPIRKVNGGAYMSPGLAAAGPGKMDDDATKKLVQRDSILMNILTVSASEKQVVSKYYFHDALLTEKDAALLNGKTADRESKGSSSKSGDSNRISTLEPKQSNDSKQMDRKDADSPPKRSRLAFPNATSENE
jgi:CW-type Zinc Finger